MAVAKVYAALEKRGKVGRRGVGKYGRCLGTLLIGGQNINEQPLFEGHAVEYP